MELFAEIQSAPLWHPKPELTLPATKIEDGSQPLPEKVNILEAALEAIDGCHNHRETFYLLCIALQRLRGSEPIVLPVEKIAAALNCHWTLIARFRRRAVAEYWLRPERPAIAHRQAASFRVLSDTPPSSEIEKIEISQNVSKKEKETKTERTSAQVSPSRGGKMESEKRQHPSQQSPHSNSNFSDTPPYSDTPPSEPLVIHPQSLSDTVPADEVETPQIPTAKINNSEISISAADPDLLSGSEKSTETDGVDFGAEEENTEDRLWF
jgi:hypothetical protein